VTRRLLRTVLPAIAFALTCAPAAAQVQVTPFVGYRFGGDLYEIVAQRPLDLDGARSFGAMVDLFATRDLAVALIYSHQEPEVDVRLPGGGGARVGIPVDHWHAGATQEVDFGRVRPFGSATLGLTRFGAGDDSEMRFSLGFGGGVKLLPARHVGVRFDARAYAVFTDGSLEAGLCTPGLCVLALDVAVTWQADFTAGLVIAF
jgi:hypothetical protein